MEYRIAINTISLRGKIESGSSLWYKFNHSFVNQTVPSSELLAAIYLGHSFCAWHNGPRKTANFACGQHIALDLDTGDERSSIPHLMRNEFVQTYAALLYTTPSHTDDAPRTRVIFLLDQPIATADGYKTAIDHIYSLFPGSDPSCVDASRFFYGSHHCHMEYPDNMLPIAHLRSMVKQAMQARRDTRPTGGARGNGRFPPEQLVQWAVEDAGGRGRNNQGYILAHRLRENGLPMTDAENYMLAYQRQVEAAKLPKYSEQEARHNLKMAYKGG